MVTSTDKPTGGADDGSDAVERYLIGNKGFKPGDDRSRVDAYQRRWRIPLDVLALATIWLIVVPPGIITSNHILYLILLRVPR